MIASAIPPIRPHTDKTLPVNTGEMDCSPWKIIDKQKDQMQMKAARRAVKRPEGC